jgi:hypothetical protein
MQLELGFQPYISLVCSTVAPFHHVLDNNFVGFSAQPHVTSPKAMDNGCIHCGSKEVNYIKE